MMEDLIDETVEFSNWVGTNNKPSSFQVGFDESREVVMAGDEELFEDDAKRDKTKYEGYTGNAGPTLEYWYHKAVIVIWPKKLPLSIARKVGCDGALDILECKAAEKDPGVVTMLKKILTCWESKHSFYWSDSVTSRLLELFPQVGGLEDFLHLLKLFSKVPELDSSTNVSRRSVARRIGLTGEKTAANITKALGLFGWDNCGSHVLELLMKDDVISRCDTYSSFACNLQALGCHDAAWKVAKRTLEIAIAACSFWNQLNDTKLYKMVKMLFSFKELAEEFGAQFCHQLKMVKTKVLLCLVVQIFPEISNEILGEDGSTVTTLFTKICGLITSRDFHRELLTTRGVQHETIHSDDFYIGMRFPRDYNNSTSSPLSVVDLVHTFCTFGREVLVSNLIRSLVDQSRRYNQQHLLKQLLDSDRIWRELSGTTTGINGLQLLVGERVNSLSAKGKPVFSWRMPSARLPNHPIVEEFRKSPLERVTYRDPSLGGLPGARKFARTFFNGYYQNGFSGTPTEGGRGVKAFCVIAKNRVAFDHEYHQWLKDQQEAKALTDRLMKIQAAPSPRVANTRTKAVVSSRDERVQQLRRIEEPGIVNLTLDDD